MTVFEYDGSYEGFLSAVFEAYLRACAGDCEIQRTGNLAGLALGGICSVVSDEKRAERVEKKLCSLSCGRVLYKAWLSGEENIENDMLACIRIALERGSAPWGMRTENCVSRVCGAAGRVGTEAHRYLQFVRFACVSEEPPVYAADIEPKYDILPMLGNHFSKRFSSQCFVIRDRSFNQTLVWDMRSWYISSDPELLRIPLHGDSEFQEMWKGYFRAVAIPWRRNKKLQAQFVPQRFRRYLTEFG